MKSSSRLEKWILACSMVVVSVITSAQNLVPNGGFEEGNCDAYPGNIGECNYWYSSLIPAGETTPEWFHECMPNSFAPPDVSFGSQIPIGSGYAGVITYRPTPEDYREIIGIQLTEPLIIGNSYLVSYKFTPITTIEEIVVLTNNFGFNFSTHQYYDNENFPINTSHFSIDSVVPITGDWYEVSEIFEADSNYQFLHLGNFYTDDETATVFNGADSFHSYYVIDEVSISISLNHKISHGLKAQVYPNPTRDKLYVQFITSFIGGRIKIINSFGSVVHEKYILIDQNTLRIDFKPFPSGIYTIMFETPKSISYEKVIKID